MKTHLHFRKFLLGFCFWNISLNVHSKLTYFIELQLNITGKNWYDSVKMPLRSIVRELKEMRDGIGNISRRSSENRQWRNRNKSHIAPDQALVPTEPIEQSQWANIPPELLVDIIRRVEESETSWPARASVIFCGSVCKSWREVMKEIVKTPEQCGRLTFPISLKQVVCGSLFRIMLFTC